MAGQDKSKIMHEAMKPYAASMAMLTKVLGEPRGEHSEVKVESITVGHVHSLLGVFRAWVSSEGCFSP